MEETVETMAVESSTTEMTQPVIVDLGKQKAGKLKALKKGEGELWEEVLDVVEEVKEMLGAEAEGKVLVPVVLLYQEKPKRQRQQRLGKMLFPYMK